MPRAFSGGQWPGASGSAGEDSQSQCLCSLPWDDSFSGVGSSSFQLWVRRLPAGAWEEGCRSQGAAGSRHSMADGWTGRRALFSHHALVPNLRTSPCPCQGGEMVPSGGGGRQVDGGPAVILFPSSAHTAVLGDSWASCPQPPVSQAPSCGRQSLVPQLRLGCWDPPASLHPCLVFCPMVSAPACFAPAGPMPSTPCPCFGFVRG